MKERNDPTDQNALQARNELKNEIQGYPIYPPEEDIYSKFQKEKNITPEDISNTDDSKKEETVDVYTNKNLSGSDLDVPGSELDDAQENIGSEDEENNYYSLGGDAHDDPDENKE